MAGIDFVARRGNQLVQQIVGFDAEPFAPGNLDPGPRLLFLTQFVTQFGGAARSERDHLIGKMRVAIGGLAVPEPAQGLDDRVLRFGLAGIDHVVDFSDVAEVGMVLFGIGVLRGGGDPAIVRRWDSGKTCDS